MRFICLILCLVLFSSCSDRSRIELHDQDRFLIALLNEDQATVKKMLNDGFDPNFRYNEGFTPLIIVVTKNISNLVPVLLEHGASPYLKDIYDRDSFEIAQTKKLSEIQKLIKDIPKTSIKYLKYKKRLFDVPIMGSRFFSFITLLDGYNKSGVHFVTFFAGSFHPLDLADDKATYYFILETMKIFKLPLLQSVRLFYLSLVVFSILVSLIFSFLLFKSWKTRLLYVSSLMLIIFLTLRSSDLYILNGLTVIISVPISLYLFFRLSNKGAWFLLSFFLLGVFLGTSYYMRAHSGTGPFLFLLVLTFFDQCSVRKKFFLASILVLGLMFPKIFFGELFSERDAFLKQNIKNYQKITSNESHYLWHNLYIGLGWVENPYVLEYSDGEGMRHARLVNKDVAYKSTEHNEILKRKYFELILQHPMVVFYNISGKFGVLFCIFLILTNYSLYLSYQYKKSRSIEIGFWIMISFNSLFGILVMPFLNLILGFIAATIFYAQISYANKWEYQLFSGDNNNVPTKSA